VIVLIAERTFDGSFVFAAVRAIATQYPGPDDVRVDVGASHLKLGPAYKCEPSKDCLAALAEFGDVHLTTDPPDQGHTGPGSNERTA
jgi:hypothetical protein